jgi:hypothetical protein
MRMRNDAHYRYCGKRARENIHVHEFEREWTLTDRPFSEVQFDPFLWWPGEKWVGFPQLSCLKRLHDFRGCRYFVMFRPPSLLAPPDRPYRCEYSRRAAGAFTSEQNAVRYLPAHRIC